MDIRGVEICRDSPANFVAEIGANHDGNFEKAVELIQEVSNSSCKFIKFQLYSAEELVSDYNREISYQIYKGGKLVEKIESIGELFNRISLPYSVHKDLYKMSRDLGLIPFSSPFSKRGVDLLEELSVDIYKVASSEVTNIPLLEYISQTGKPIILSTGKSYMQEVKEAFDVLSGFGSEVILMHCTSCYPNKDENLNLNLISTLLKEFPDSVVGYSNHLTIEEFERALMVSVALGAKLIERHVTYSISSEEGPDHYFSSSTNLIDRYIKIIRSVEKVLGSSEKTLFSCEKKGYILARPSIRVAQDVRIGEVLTEEKIKISRPNNGCSPKFYNYVIDSVADKNYKENDPILFQ